MRYVALAIAFVIMLITAAVMVDIELRQIETDIHVHVPMTYKMIGRIHTDTLCVHPDTALYANGNHRPVPEVLAGVAEQTLNRNEIFIINH